MTVKTKIALNYLRIANWNRKAKKHAKKYTKFNDQDRYPLGWRHKFVLKKIKSFLKIMKIELEVIGFEDLPKAPAMLAPNHSSFIDPAIMIAALENKGNSPEDLDAIPLFLAKEELSKNKKIKGYAQLLNTFFIDRNNPRKAIAEIDGMSNLAREDKRYEVIFPEGTRTKDGNLLEFKGGAFRSAKKSFSPIIPVTINNSFSSSDLSRTDKLKVQVIFHKAIKPMTFISQDTKSIAKNVKRIIESKWVKPIGKPSTTEGSKT